MQLLTCAEGSSETTNEVNEDSDSRNMKRNLVGFWLLGLTNNFAYVIMLSAAHDILKDQEKEENGQDSANITTTIAPTPSDPSKEYLHCNPISTGAILLADILPTLIIKVTSPLYIHLISYRLKVITVGIFNFLAFLLVAFSQGIWMSLFGVVCASICGGLGEVTFMSYASFFHRNVISTYASGTGGAGIFGALAYAGLTTAGLTPKVTVLIMVVVPVIMLTSFFLLIKKPENSRDTTNDAAMLLMEEKRKEVHFSVKEKLHMMVPLLKFMIPLMLVYIAEYFINQGLHELLYYNGIWLSSSEQYRWYQVDYQLGVFISRSSVNCLEIKRLWILPILQIINMVLLIFQVFYQFIPSIWIIFAIVLYEGLLGGAAFVNTFYRITKEIPNENKEFSLGAATMADSVGIALAGAMSIPSHNHICSLHLTIPK